MGSAFYFQESRREIRISPLLSQPPLRVAEPVSGILWIAPALSETVRVPV
jgi:hypothetical protein